MTGLSFVTPFTRADSHCAGTMNATVTLVIVWEFSIDNKSMDYHRCGLDDPGFDSQKGQEIWFFKTSRSALRSSLSLLFDGYGGSVAGVKRAGREVDHSPPSSA